MNGKQQRHFLRVFSVYPWVKPSIPYGAVMATRVFFDAIYQQADEVVLAYASKDHRKFMESQYPKARVCTLKDAITYLQTNPPSVLQAGDWMGSFEQHLRLRNYLISCDDQRVPVLGMAHALNTPDARPPVGWQNLVRPGDGVLVSSHPKVFSRISGAPSEMVIGRPLGIDPTLEPRDSPDPQRFAIPSNPDTKIILCMARFDPTYKVDLVPLIHVFLTEIFPKHPEYHLVLAGYVAPHVTEYYHQLVRWAVHPQIQFIPNFDPSLRSELYSCAHLFIQISDNFQELFGLSPREAARLGVPCIVSDFSGLKAFKNKIPTIFNPDVQEKISLYSKNEQAFLYAQSLVNDFSNFPQMAESILTAGSSSTEFFLSSDSPSLRYSRLVQSRKRVSSISPFSEADTNPPFEYASSLHHPFRVFVLRSAIETPIYPLIYDALDHDLISNIFSHGVGSYVDLPDNADPFTVMWLWKQRYIKA